LLISIGSRPAYAVKPGDYVQTEGGEWVRVVQRTIELECQDRLGRWVLVRRAPREEVQAAVEVMD